MDKPLVNKNILILVDKAFEDLELLYPRFRLIEAGATVTVAGKDKDMVYEGKHGCPIKSDQSFQNLKADHFDALVIPGGYAPDKLRAYPEVLDLVKQFHQKEKLIAFICHAGWVPASAQILKGVTCTSVKNIKDDLIHAGAHWEDEAVVIDRHFISSRTPEDLPLFCPAIIDWCVPSK